VDRSFRRSHCKDIKWTSDRVAVTRSCLLVGFSKELHSGKRQPKVLDGMAGRGWRNNIGSDKPDNYRQSMWNGYSTTKTKPCMTLFVANIPPNAWFERVEALFLKDQGMTHVRQAKRGTMVFVDYEHSRAATEAMLKHQDHRFPGIERGDGLKIDFDKDPDQKRNKAHAREQQAQRKAELSKTNGVVPADKQVFPTRCAKCKDTVHKVEDCPMEVECQKCQRTGHLAVHCCARAPQATKEPVDTTPLVEELPEGFASAMLARMQNEAQWGTSTQPVAKKAKLGAPTRHIIVKPAKKSKPATLNASITAANPSEEGKTLPSDGRIGHADTTFESTLSPDAAHSGLFGLVDYGSGSDSDV